VEVGFDTIGNATLICYDKRPILVTDPWLVGSAYFQSWTLSHEIPAEQKDAILAAQYVYVTHGHPDHLSSESLKLLKDKKILLPDHVGSRIADGLKKQGFKVHVLCDRKWMTLSDRIRVLSIADYNQDAILLVDVNGILVADLNDASERGWGNFIRKTARNYKTSFLLCLSGYGDADMINYFDESGQRIPPHAAKRLPFGKNIAARAENLNLKFFAPFSSMHMYQRADSIWANEYTTKTSDHAIGFASKRCEIVPAFIRYDCLKDNVEEIRPAKKELSIVSPQDADDSWDDPIEPSERKLVTNYFKSIESLDNVLDYIEFVVAKEPFRIEFVKRKFRRGVTFEVPRNSLVTSARYEIFDDLLIGNYMTTTLHGSWQNDSLNPEFSPLVAKYADNGFAKTDRALRSYFREYRRRASFDYFRYKLYSKSVGLFRTMIPPDTKLYQVSKAAYHKMLR